ncbi:hypothetical protein M011DRAFT_125412 [Sporormia fimetaria CBS 119925]|uniref:Uncharacterized protein n=1 Tax=Sporormia fimetaria CBS 119925 TaxID=1340428 RepID=A0A6A6V8M8_9PLEO|nr:hypothetical protein M011DRAFT_125412 [Sporormia fimetaria CBS 119925]
MAGGTQHDGRTMIDLSPLLWCFRRSLGAGCGSLVLLLPLLFPLPAILGRIVGLLCCVGLHRGSRSSHALLSWPTGLTGGFPHGRAARRPQYGSVVLQRIGARGSGKSSVGRRLRMKVVQRRRDGWEREWRCEGDNGKRRYAKSCGPAMLWW